MSKGPGGAFPSATIRITATQFEDGSRGHDSREGASVSHGELSLRLDFGSGPDTAAAPHRGPDSEPIALATRAGETNSRSLQAIRSKSEHSDAYGPPRCKSRREILVLPIAYQRPSLRSPLYVALDEATPDSGPAGVVNFWLIQFRLPNIANQFISPSDASWLYCRSKP